MSARGLGIAIGETNSVAVEAAIQLATAAVPPFSMLVVQGTTGTGKSELLRGIAAVHHMHRGGVPLQHFSAHDLSIGAVAAKALGEALLDCELLLLDDFDFLLHRSPQIDDMLLRAIDYMSRDGRRIAIATAIQVTDLERVEPRLLSRLTGGLVVDVRQPEQALREAIIRQKAAAWPSLSLEPHIVEMMARKLGGNGHLLAGSVNRLGICAGVGGHTIDEDYVNRELGDLLRAAPRISVARIQERVAHYFRIPVLEMTSQRRGREVARPRQVAMYLSKQLTPKSLPDIGRRFGGRDHTTVIHGIRQVERLRETDFEIDRAVTALSRELQQ